MDWHKICFNPSLKEILREYNRQHIAEYHTPTSTCQEKAPCCPACGHDPANSAPEPETWVPKVGDQVEYYRHPSYGGPMLKSIGLVAIVQEVGDSCINIGTTSGWWYPIECFRPWKP